MSTEYILHIKRKSDKKLLGSVHCSIVKNILDGNRKDIIHCHNSFSYDKVKFSYDDLNTLSNVLYNDLNTKYLERVKCELMLCCSKSKEAIDELKEQILTINEDIKENLEWQLCAVYTMMGYVSCVVENLYKRGQLASEYNALDLQSNKNDHKMIWCSDVYCELEEC